MAGQDEALTKLEFVNMSRSHQRAEPRTGCTDAGGNNDLFLLVTRASLLRSGDKVVLVTGTHGFTTARCREPGREALHSVQPSTMGTNKGFS